jgi:DNA polymerase
MLSKGQMKKILFLNESIQKCRRCEIWKNGMAVPYWTENSKIMIMAEAPGRDEVRKNLRTPLVGKAGRLLFGELRRKKIGFIREDFLLLNVIQCRPVIRGRNGKPSPEETNNCRFWVEKYIKVFNPKIILALGNYALSYFLESHSGTTKESGTVISLENDIKIIPCLHPASLLYNPENIHIFRSSLIILREEVEKICPQR